MNNLPEFKIHRLCRDQKTITRFEEEGKKYQLPDQVLVTGLDYYTFIENIIKNCKDDYALLCHDDVVVPLDIADRVQECIVKADNFCGSDNWGIVGNAGIEAISLRTVRFLKDPHTAVIPYKSLPIPVVSIDGNTMLLNVRNLRKKQVKLPVNVRGFHLYDFIALVECYRKRLFSLVDSTLYVYHKSGGEQKGFDKHAGDDKFQSYWSKNFINHKVYTINGPIEIQNPNLDYLREGSQDKRIDFYNLVKNMILDINVERSKPTLNIITKTNLRHLFMLRRMIESIQLSQIACKAYLDIRLIISINNVGSVDIQKIITGIRKDYNDMDISFINCVEKTKMSPRLHAVKCAVETISNDASQFVWIVDDDDFIMPKELKLLSHYLNNNTVFVGKSESFDEKWSKTNHFPESSEAKPGFYTEITYARNYLGDNHVPICSVVFPAHVLKEIFTTHKLLGDYYEDYALLFLAQANYNIQYIPILLAGVSHHDKNTVFEQDRTHWDYSYTTFLTEITNSGVINNSEFELNSTLDNYSKNYQSGKFLMSLALNKGKTILSLLFRLKIRTLINIIKSYL